MSTAWLTTGVAAILDPRVLPYILLSTGALVIILAAWVIRLELKMRRFTVGKSGHSLEASFVQLQKEYDASLHFRAQMEQYLLSVEKRLRRTVQGNETVRFNPFQGDGSGGNQSFATAMLNEVGDGVVFSSIYARDRMCIFAKPLQSFQSEHELTEEERMAVEKARLSLTGTHTLKSK